MPAHVHAESIIQYGQDALTTDEPWKLWEFESITEEWKSLDEHPLWKIDTKYRRKQKIININSFEVPEPVREPLLDGQIYYTPSLLGIKHSGNCMKWRGSNIENILLKNGLIHLTPEAAELHAKALLSFTACATAST